MTFAATGIGLALGILYAWSVIRGGIPEAWGWSNADKALPYAVACLVFALTMVPAGRLQDRLGPRGVSTFGGLLAGLGCIVAGLGGSSLVAFVAGFGVLTGIGIGFGYAAMTPAAIKWFPPERTGLVAGIVVAGFGIAPVFIAPLSAWLLGVYATRAPNGTIEQGVSATMITLGLGIMVVVVLLAQLVRNPPAGSAAPARSSAATPRSAEVGWRPMLASGRFWSLWAMYFCGATAGLVFISVAQELGKRALDEWAFVAVVVLAVGNASGRVVAGLLSDLIGRFGTLGAAFAAQAVVISVLYWVTVGAGSGAAVVLVVLFALGLNYGANLSLFPAACKDLFGLASFGLNYGLLFTAWGAAGLLMPWLNGLSQDLTGAPHLSFRVIIGMLLGAAVLAFASRRPARGAPTAVAEVTR